MTKLSVGAQAPDFALPASDGKTYRLSELKGRPVVLAFYPGDMTATCTKQLCSYTDRWDDLSGTGAIVLGISKQGLDSHQEFVGKHGLKAPLLADVSETAITAYGVRGPFGRTKRSVFVIDANGIIRWMHVSTAGVTYVKPGVILEQLREL